MMKNALFFILLIIPTNIFSQPQSINYQGIARDAGGNSLISQNISIRLSVLDSSATGQVVYTETHTTTTNNSGLFNLSIGAGTIVNGTFSGIPWGNGDKWLKIEMDSNAGNNFQLIGISQFLSVPFALFAGKSLNATSRIQAFITSGFFTVPTDVSQVIVEIWGAGGGGGGGGGAQLNQSHGSGGGGGSGGCYRKVILTVVPGQSIPIVIGIGGNGGSFGTPSGNATSGTNGQASSFGNLCTANGGIGGGAGSTTCYGCAGGNGGNNICSTNSPGLVGGTSTGAGPGSGGKGGDAYNGGNLGGEGGNSGGQPGSPPAQSGLQGVEGSGGGGGGAASWWVGGNGGSGGKGGDGLIIIYF